MSDKTISRISKLLKLYFVHRLDYSYGNLTVQVKLSELLPGVIAKDEFHERLSFVTIERPSKKSMKDIQKELRVSAMQNANAFKKLKKINQSTPPLAVEGR